MTTEKKIQDYLHLYGLGLDIMTPDGMGRLLVVYPKGIEVVLSVIKPGQVMKGRYSIGGTHYFYNYEECQPILSKLEDITEEDQKAIFKLVHKRDFHKNGDIRFFPKNEQSGYEARVVLMSGVERLGIEFDGTIWADSDMIIMRFNTHEVTHYLLKKGYDLFGLIEAGLAVDKKTVKP